MYRIVIAVKMLFTVLKIFKLGGKNMPVLWRMKSP